MRLVRYGRPGKEKPGLFDEEGRLRDLSGIIDDIDASQLSDKALRKLAKLEWKTLPLVRGNPRLGVPVKGVGKFIGIGMNYADHALETGAEVPKATTVRPTTRGVMPSFSDRPTAPLTSRSPPATSSARPPRTSRISTITTVDPQYPQNGPPEAGAGQHRNHHHDQQEQDDDAQHHPRVPKRWNAARSSAASSSRSADRPRRRSRGRRMPCTSMRILSP